MWVSPAGCDDADLHPVRHRILRVLAESYSIRKMTSLVIGRNAAHLNKFNNRHQPRIFAGHDRDASAGDFGLSTREVRT